MRVVVDGNSGAGKSTLARQLAARLQVECLELDSIYHQANWEPLPAAEFERRVAEFSATDNWVVDGNYRAVRPIIWARAQVVVWLDLPRSVVMRQLVRRTLTRVVLRRTLWNGNKESATNLFRRDEENILHWSWTHHDSYREGYSTAMDDPENAHLRFVRVTSRPKTDDVIARVVRATNRD